MPSEHLPFERILEQTAQKVMTACGFSAGLFYSVRLFSNLSAVSCLETPVGGTSAFRKGMDVVRGKRFEAGWGQITSFTRFELHRFEDIELQADLVAQFWRSVGIEAVIGTNVVNSTGGYVGWIGSFALKGDKIPDRIPATLSKLRPEICAELCTALTLEEARQGNGGVIVMTSDGKIESVSARLTEWIEFPDVRDILVNKVKSLCRDDFDGGKVEFWVSTTLVEVERVYPGDRYAILVLPLGQIVVPKLAMMSLEKRRVTQLLMNGMTVKQATQQLCAEKIGRSESTVREHLKEIHRELGVTTRGELVRAACEGLMGAGLASREELT